MKRKLFYPLVIAILCVLGAHVAVLAQTCNVTLSTTSIVCPGGSNGSASVLLNGKLLTVSGIDAGNNPITCLAPSTPGASDNCTSCNQTITSSGSVSIGVGQKVCITAANYSGDLQVSGGTLVICGNANVQNMNLNTNGQPFTLIVRGRLTFSNVNSDANMVLRNFGTVTFNNSVGFNGRLENHGTLITNGDLSINASTGRLLSTGLLRVTGNFNNFNTATIGGLLNIGGNLQNNGGSQLLNLCTITTGGEFINNTTVTNTGLILVGTWTRLNGGSSLFSNIGSQIRTQHLQVDGRLQGIGATCVVVKVSGTTMINGSGIIAGRLDLCDANGIETNTGQVQSPATTNCSCQPLPPITWGIPLQGFQNPISNLGIGTYTVTVQPAGCAATVNTFTITAPSPIVGNVAVVGKTATLTLSGGNGGFTYVWPNNTSSTGNSFVFVNNGSYSVRAIDSKGCFNDFPFTIGTGTILGLSGDAPCASVVVNYTSDNRVSLTCDCPGVCSVVGFNGIPTTPGTLFQLPTKDSVFVVRVPGGGTISVLVNGSSNPGTSTSTGNNLSVTYTVSPETRPGGNNGSVALQITGGSGNYTILNSTNTTNTFSSGNSTITGLSGAGTTITVLDNVTGQTYVVTIPIPTIPATNVAIQVVSTKPDGTPNQVIAVITPPTGFITGPYSVVWSTNTTGTGPITIPNSASITGFVSVQVTDKYGNVFTDIISTVSSCTGSAFVPQISSITPDCFNGTNGSLSLTNLPAGSNVVWYGLTTGTGTTLSNLTAGNYGLLVTSTLGTGAKCNLYQGSSALSQPSLLSVSVSNNGNAYTALASGGTPNIGYTWSNGLSGANATLTASGTFRVTATDSKGCQARSVVVKRNICAGTISLTRKNPSCINGSDGSLEALSNQSNSTYYWSGTGISSPTNRIQSNLSKGSYVVAVTVTTSGCISRTGIAIADPQPMTVVHQLTTGNGVNILVNGGTPNYQVKWTFDNKIAERRTDLNPGTTYSVIVNDSKLCATTYTFTYQSCTSLPIVATVGVNDKTATVTATGGTGSFVYTWPDGSSTNSNTYTAVNSGVYSVNITDARLCTINAPFAIGNTVTTSGSCNSINITYLPNNLVNVSCICPGACSVVGLVGGNGTITGTGTLTGTTLKQPCQDSTIVVKLPDGGTKTLLLKGSGKCVTGGAYATLIVLPTITPATCNSNNGVITLAITNGSGNYSIQNSVNTQVNGLTIASLPGGAINITITDNNTFVSTVIGLNVPTTPTIDPENVNIQVVLLNPDGTPSQVNGVVTGPITPASYVWSTGNVGNGPVNIPSSSTLTGIVSLTVSDATGCTVRKDISVVPTCAGNSFVPLFSSTAPSCFSSNNGSIAITNLPSNANAVWSGPVSRNGAQVLGLPAGAYSLIVINTISGATCTIYNGSAVTLTTPSALSVSVLQNINLYTATTSGGTPSLTYAWSNGISGPSAVLSTTGIYQITATDSKGCKAYNQVVIEPQACLGTINLQLTNPSCFNASNGIISALVTNTGVKYFWTGPGITTPGFATVSQLKKGFYQVSITSTTPACAFLAGADLGQPDDLTATHKLVGTNGVNILVNGGTPNYQVKWRQDNRIADSRNDLTSGTAYTVDITDGKNCTIPYSFTYLSCASVPITATVGINQKTATVSVTAGVPSYVYTWPNGSTNTGNSFTFVNNGNYSVQVSDSRNCTSTFPFSITNGGGGVVPTFTTPGICNQIDVVYITPSTLSINCNCPGACTVVGTVPGGNTLTNTYPTPCNDSTFVVKVAGGGYVNVTVKGRGNCGQKSTSTVPNNNPNGQLVATYTAICNPGSSGTAVINILKGTGPYSLTYGGGPVTSVLTVTGLPLGNTNITVSDLGSGFTTTLGVNIACSSPINSGEVSITVIGTTSSGLPIVRGEVSPTVTVTKVTWSTGDIGLGPITVPGYILTTTGFITATFTDQNGNSVTKIQTFVSTCSGTTYTPNISFTNPSCAGGSNGTLTLNNPLAGAINTWSGNIPAVLTGNSLNGLTAGNFSLTITKPSGVGDQVCLVYDGNAATINQPAALTANINQSGNTFTAVSSGGTAPVSFLWTTSATSPIVSLQNQGTYFVTITDSKGCTAGDYLVVSPPLCLGLISINSTAPGCVNGSDGILKAVSSLAGAYYNWSGPSIASPNNSLINGLGKGNYVVTVSTPGCSAYVGVELTDPPRLEVSHQYVGGKQVNIVVTGGSPNYSVKWRNDNLVADNRSDLIVGVSYTVDVSDAKGCTQFYTFRYEPCGDFPVSTIVVVTSNTATANISGGTLPFVYNWTTTIPGVTLSSPNAISQTGLANGTYNFTVTDAKACRATAKVTVPDCGLTVSAQQDFPTSIPTACDGQASVSISPLASGTSIAWDGVVSATQFIKGCAGEHTVRITTADNCALDRTVTITSGTTTPPDPCSYLPIQIQVESQVDKKCFSDRGFVDVKVTGGIGPLNYRWFTNYRNRSEQFNSTSEDLLNPLPGTYRLVVTDRRGCSSNTLTINVGGPASELIVGNKVVSATCVGGFGTALVTVSGGLAPYQVNWPDLSPDFFRADLAAGLYTATVTDAASCAVNTAVTLIEPSFNGQIYASQRKLCPGETSVLTAALVPGYDFIWTGLNIAGGQPPLNQRSITVTQTGIYSLLYSSAGCTNQMEFVVVTVSGACNQYDPLACAPLEIIGLKIDENKNCLGQQFVSASATGVYRFKSYIAETQRDFKADFVNSILNGVQESLTMEYSDQEHHYTLYYYDQAGSLVRTVPPAGVVTLDNSQTASAISDLTSGGANIYTDHTLTTTYKYNSLNQLMAQDIPDHRRQNLWETLPNVITLEPGQVATGATYGSATQGILLANTNNKTDFFRTLDGGKSWVEQTNININDVLDIQRVDNSAYVYAVGVTGLFLQSTDGGATFTVKTGPSNMNLDKVYFTSATNGAILTKEGSVWTTTNGGDTWSPEGTNLKTKGLDHVNGFTFEPTIWRAVADKNGVGSIWKTTDNGNSWSEETTSNGYYSGETKPDGNNYRIKLKNSTNGNFTLDANGNLSLVRGETIDYSRSYNVSTPVTGLTNAAGFFVQVAGLAPIVTFTPVGGTGANSVFIQGIPATLIRQQNGTFISINPINDLGIVSTDKWLVTDKDYNLMITTPISGQANTLQASQTGITGVSRFFQSDDHVIYMFQSGSNNIKKANVSGTTVTLTDALALPDGISPNAVSSVYIRAGSPIKALIVVGDRQIYEYNGSTWLNRSNNLIKQPLRAIQTNGNTGYAAGDNGELYAWNGTSWDLQVNDLVVPNISKLAIGSDKIRIASGSNIYKISNQDFNYIPEATLDNTITSFQMQGERGLAATANGTIYAKADAQPGSDWTSSYSLPNAGFTSTYAYAGANDVTAGVSGELAYRSNGTWAASAPAQIQPITAVDYPTSTGALAVGRQGTVLVSNNSGANWDVKYAQTTNNLLAANGDGSNWVVGGEAGTVRYTANGGSSWSTSSISANGSPVRAIQVRGNNVLLTAGNKLFRSSNGGQTFSLDATLTNEAYGLYLDKDGYGMIVGNAGMVYRITPSGAAFAYAPITTDANTNDDKGSNLPVADFRAVTFTDRLVGYISGPNGLVLKTSDGGKHWRSEPGGTGSSTPVIAMADKQYGTLVKANGEVSRLRDRSDLFSTRFWYDELGRLVLSQNSKQFYIEKYLDPAITVPGTGFIRAYSYTLYDDLGRISEVGEILTRQPVPTAKVESQVLYANVRDSYVPASVQREITRTYYDEPAFTNLYNGFTQENLRPRVASVTYSDVIASGSAAIPSNGATYDRGTHYSYDEHGNVKSLVQEIKTSVGSITKKTDYQYDLISGKVNQVIYQKDAEDQFIHRYNYDGDNRITSVETSRDGIIWDRDAAYQYYAHGPLASSTIGGQNVEIQNFAYTLQGWIKGVNGYQFSYALGYYTGDYSPIGTPAAAPLATPVAKSLYNGNIATWASTNRKLSTTPWVQQFTYDQLNRITTSASQGVASANGLKTSYDYDPNGNITSLTRTDISGNLYDQLSYNYETVLKDYLSNTNKLRWVDDAQPATANTTDIDDQHIDNYQYDDIGNLTKDDKEDIATIEWTVYGKVKKVIRTPTSTKPDLEFAYDASGNRVAKIVKDKSSSSVPVATYYVRDGTGNVMGVYEQSGGVPRLVENHIYGSSRVGVSSPDGAATNTAQDVEEHQAGRREYEFTDHLGNVRATASDLLVNGQSNVITASDYYPFGSLARTYSPTGYRYGFNTQEKVDEIAPNHYTAEYWEYDSRLGKRWNIDPVVKHEMSSYLCFGNNPVAFADPNGDDWEVKSSKDSKGHVTYDVKVNAKLINKSSNKSINMAKFQAALKKQITSNLNIKEKDFTINFDMNIQTVTDDNDIKETDHVFAIVDQSVVGSGVNADAQKKGLLIRIGTDMVPSVLNGTNTRTLTHELLHTGNLDHPHDDKGKGAISISEANHIGFKMSYGQIGDNILSQSRLVYRINGQGYNTNKSNKLIHAQMGALYKDYKNGVLNNNYSLKNSWSLKIVPTSTFTMPMLVPYSYKELKY